MGDLEIALNKTAGEYPALVREVLQGGSKDDLAPKCASISNSGYCWLVSKHSLFVWKLNERGRALEKSVQKLQLAPSGLPYTADTILLYGNPQGVPGVVAISGEGNVRHWPVLGGPHSDTIIDLSNQVAFSLQTAIPFAAGLVVVLLTTTSGSLYRLEASEGRLQIDWRLLGSLEERSITRTFSSFLFGQSQSATGMQVARSIILRTDLPEDDEDIGDGESCDVCVVSASSLSLFNPMEKSLLWSVSAEKLLSVDAVAKLRESGIRCSEQPRLLLLDGAEFRDGLLLLAAVASETDHLQFILAYVDSLEEEAAPSRASAIFVLSHPLSQNTQFCDAPSLIGRFHLALSSSVVHSASMKHTDGVCVIHSSFIQIVHLPDVIDRDSHLEFNRTLPLHDDELLLGFGCNHHVFLLRSRSGIEAVRLLPKGFTEKSMPEGSEDCLRERLAPDGADSKQMTLLKTALLHFSSKNIMEASSVLEELKKEERVELPSLVYSFVVDLMDSPPFAPSISTDLAHKNVLLGRLFLFLRSMHLMDQLCKQLVSVLPEGAAETEQHVLGGLLEEAAERAAVAAVFPAFHSSRERKLQESAARRCAREQRAANSTFESLFLSKLSSLHLAFSALVEVAAEKRKSQTAEKRVEILFALARIFSAAANAVEKARRNSMIPEAYIEDVKWLRGDISTAYRKAVSLLLEELEADSSDVAPNTRVQLKDAMVSVGMFALEERKERAEGDPLLLRIFNIGEANLALELAERFKDFKLMVKITHAFEPEEKRKYIENYKRRFAADGFELYICNYYLQHKMTGELLEQRGANVDNFLSQHDSIRWRRQLQNHQYQEAASSLLTTAEAATKLWDKKMYCSLAYLSVCCATEEQPEMKSDALAELTLIGHNEAVPQELLSHIFGNASDRPLSLEEIVDVNLADENDQVAGLLRALHAVSSELIRIEEEKDDENKKHLHQILKTIWMQTVGKELETMKDVDDASKSLFGILLDAVITSSEMSKREKELSLPPVSELTSSSVNEGTKQVIGSLLTKSKLLIAAS